MNTELKNRETPTRLRVVSPAVDVLESEDTWRVIADLPGVTPEDVEVRFDNGTLVLEGTWRPETLGETLETELTGRIWRRSFAIPRSVDVEHVSARVEGGVVTIELPKSEAHRPRRIPVRS